MKTAFFLLPFLLLGACQSESEHHNADSLVTAQTPPPVLTAPYNLLTETDAEKIIGETARLTDSSSSVKNNVAVYQSTFTADSTRNGKTGNIYFTIENYAQDSSAHRVYADIKKANEAHEGITTLQLGNEAYFHSDGENFYFILVRKNTKLFHIKVNKLTEKTSLKEFNDVAKRITAAI